MKLSFLSLIVLLAACESVTSPANQASLPVRGNNAILANDKTEFSTPGMLVACNGETVTMTGTLHVMMKETDTPNGGISVFVNMREDLSGTGDVTGLKYQGSVTNDYRVEQNGATVVSVPTTIRLISQGKSPNFFYDSVLHVTINADGTLTVDRESENTRCN